MKKSIVIALGVAVLASGHVRAARDMLHGVPVAGVTEALASCRNAAVGADASHTPKGRNGQWEVETILQSMASYQARHEDEAERMMGHEELSVEQVLYAPAGNTEATGQ